MVRQAWRLLVFIGLSTLFAALPITTAQENADPVADSLNRLGVNTNTTNRTDESGNVISEEFSPLGTTYSPAKRVELAVLGLPLANTDAEMAIINDFGDGGGVLTSSADTPYTESNVFSRGNPNTRRNATSGDMDGDGIDELVTIYMRDQELVVRFFDDAMSNFVETESVLALAQGVQDIQATTADVNGDGQAELLIVTSYDNRGELFIASFATQGRIALIALPMQIASPSLDGASISLEIAAGNVDYDTSEEFVIIFNEIVGDSEGIAQYFVYDDSNSNYAIVNAGLVQGIVQGVKTAVIANVALGDIDGDGLDEIVMAGLTNRETQCDANGHLLIALDDSLARFTNIGTRYDDIFMRGCPSFSAWRLRYLHLYTFDVDGDFVDEISVNQFVYDDWKNEAPFTLAYEIPVENNLIRVNDFGWWDRSTSDFSVGDFTGDGRDNLILYMQNRNTIDIWGLSNDGIWARTNTIDVSFNNAQNPIVPVLVPLNTDTDSPVLQYVVDDTQLVFTEPIVIAALAAPPCGTGQNTDSCTTVFGSQTSTSAEDERSITVTTGFNIGVQIDGGFITQSEFELKETVTATVTERWGTTVTRTDTITFATGAIEDSVIFTSVPIDRYTYRVVSHPDPIMLGSTVTVDLPRDPVTILVERNFFNASVEPNSIQIDERVFQHQVGDPTTYPTRGQKQQLLAQYQGFESQLQNVGQGTGTNTVEIAIGREVSQGRSIGLGITLEINATGGGILGGYSVGMDGQRSLNLSYGSATIYGGTVSNIDEANFAANAYSFGLFSYVYTDPTSGQQFQVLNYWVE